MSEETFKELENYILEKHRIAQLSEKIRSQISIFVTLKKISYKDMLSLAEGLRKTGKPVAVCLLGREGVEWNFLFS